MAQDAVVTIKNVSVDDVDETAEVKHRSQGNKSQQVYVKMRNHPCNSRPTQITKSLATILICHFGNSTDGESDDSDDEYVTGDSLNYMHRVSS